jgi:imidazolonepropionase-like amidohydrolase
MLQKLTAFIALALIPLLPAQSQTIILQADRFLDVGSGEMVSPAVIVVENGIIVAVNPSSIPENTSVVDLAGVTLLPGLMDMHTHLSGSLEGDWVHRDVKETPADQALRAAHNGRTTLEAGFTTVRNVGAGGFSVIAYDRAIREGRAVGPNIVSAGHSLGITGGHCDVTGYRPGLMELDFRSGVADGADVVKAVRYQIKHGAKVIKICATAGVLSFEGPVGAQQYSEAEMTAIVDEATLHGVKVAAHAHGTKGIIAASNAGVASIEHGSILNEEAIETLVRNGTYLVPTNYIVERLDLSELPDLLAAKAESIMPLMVDGLEAAIARGVKIAMGTDAAVIPHGENAKEISIYVKRGMSPLEAIRTATTNAADLLGVDDRGMIKTGLMADIIGVRGDPLDDVTLLEDVLFVMKGGIVYKNRIGG